MEKWMKKIWSVHTEEYYSAIKRNAVLTYATTWMNPENFVLAKRYKTQKATPFSLHLHELSRKANP
jgi:hypothetical protein